MCGGGAGDGDEGPGEDVVESIDAVLRAQALADGVGRPCPVVERAVQHVLDDCQVDAVAEVVPAETVREAQPQRAAVAAAGGQVLRGPKGEHSSGADVVREALHAADDDGPGVRADEAVRGRRKNAKT